MTGLVSRLKTVVKCRRLLGKSMDRTRTERERIEMEAAARHVPILAQQLGLDSKSRSVEDVT